MNCPKCKKNNYRKDGLVNRKQRFYCKTCDYHYTVPERKQKPISFKRIALALHIIGLSNRKIKEVIGVSDVAIMNWVNKYRTQSEQLRDIGIKVQTVRMTEINEFAKDTDGLLLIKFNKQCNDIYKISK